MTHQSKIIRYSNVAGGDSWGFMRFMEQFARDPMNIGYYMVMVIIWLMIVKYMFNIWLFYG